MSMPMRLTSSSPSLGPSTSSSSSMHLPPAAALSRQIEVAAACLARWRVHHKASWQAVCSHRAGHDAQAADSGLQPSRTAAARRSADSLAAEPWNLWQESDWVGWRKLIKLLSRTTAAVRCLPPLPEHVCCSCLLHGKSVPCSSYRCILASCHRPGRSWQLHPV